MRYDYRKIAWSSLTEDELYAKFESIQKRYSKFPVLGEGRHRITYKVSSRSVVKVPLNQYGIDSNYREHYLFRRYGKTRSPDGIVYAPCRIKVEDEIPLLVMAYAEQVPASQWPELPKWVHYVDGHQVGVTADGTLVVYDYGW